MDSPPQLDSRYSVRSLEALVSRKISSLTVQEIELRNGLVLEYLHVQSTFTRHDVYFISRFVGIAIEIVGDDKSLMEKVFNAATEGVGKARGEGKKRKAPNMEAEMLERAGQAAERMYSHTLDKKWVHEGYSAHVLCATLWEGVDRLRSANNFIYAASLAKKAAYDQDKEQHPFWIQDYEWGGNWHEATFAAAQLLEKAGRTAAIGQYKISGDAAFAMRKYAKSMNDIDPQDKWFKEIEKWEGKARKSYQKFLELDENHLSKDNYVATLNVRKKLSLLHDLEIRYPQK